MIDDATIEVSRWQREAWQLVPGRLTAREKLERMAAEPMRSEREQRAPGPLFDTEARKQGEMF